MCKCASGPKLQRSVLNSFTSISNAEHQVQRCTILSACLWIELGRPCKIVSSLENTLTSFQHQSHISERHQHTVGDISVRSHMADLCRQYRRNPHFRYLDRTLSRRNRAVNCELGSTCTASRVCSSRKARGR